jgi:hypothetical protein
MKLFVATPMYGGQCYGAYTDFIIKLRELIDFVFFPLFNESHIDRARNVCVEHFLRSDCDQLFFIDADISCSAKQALELANLEPDIVCAFYPKKEIDWKRVKEAVELGWADKDPQLLERFATQLVYTPLPGDNASRSIYELTPIAEGGTGFMRIRRRVFDHIAALHPELRYPTELGNATCFFDAQLRDRRFLTEDYSFCHLARSAGFDIMLAPWIRLIHHGYYHWIGDIEALSKVALQEIAA